MDYFCGGSFSHACLLQNMDFAAGASDLIGKTVDKEAEQMAFMLGVSMFSVGPVLSLIR